MNQARRKEIYKAVDELNGQKEAIEALRDEEQEYYDNMPESLQNGEKGETASQHIENFETAIESLDSAIEALNELL